MEGAQEEQKVVAPVEKLPFTTYREYFDDSYKVRATSFIYTCNKNQLERC